jgi:hypothetical protein
MTALNFSGGGSPAVSTSFTDRWVLTASGVDLPTTGRVADNGNKPIYVSTAGCYWAGRGATRTLALSVGGASTGWKTVGSAGSAYYSGQMGIGAVFANGGTVSVRIDANGAQSFYFGRASGTGSVDSYGTSFGKLAGSLEYYEVPNSPTAVSVAQAALENAVNVSWTAPSNNGGSAVTSYKLKWSYNSDMSGSTIISTGTTATTYKITGLSYGSTVYVQVAAVNIVATAAGTSSVYSSTASGFITPPDLPLNGWANFGSHGHSTFTLDHTVIPALVPETGMQRKSTSTSATGTYATGNYGIEKTYTDLVVGRQYILSGKAILLTAAVPGNIYRFAVNGIGNGSSVTLTSTTVGATIPSYTFTASSTTHTVQIELAETVSAIVGVMEHVGFYDFALTRVATDLIYRVQDNNDNGSLVDHFDLATQSVGAYWWVDKLNTTQFAQDFNYVLPSAKFSDVVADGNIYYNDIKTSFDTTAVINDITFDNIGRRRSALGSDRFDSYNVEWNERDTTSVTNWGARSYKLTTNLYTAVHRLNRIPNPHVAIDGSYLINPAGYGTVTQSRQALSTISTGATGFLPVGTTQPAVGGGAFVVSAFRGTSNGQTLIGYGGEFGVTTAAPFFSVDPSTQYTGSAFLRTGVGQATSGNGSIQIYWYDINGVFLSVSSGATSAISATAWTRYSLTATSPATARYGYIYSVFGYTGANNTGFRYFSTCVQLESAATASTWFSGDTTDDLTYVYEWEGQQGNSRSIRYTNMMDTRTGELLADFATPIVRVDSVRWNTAQNPTLATNLDIGSLINIEFNGTTGLYRIVGISHDINPDRWMMNLQVAKV